MSGLMSALMNPGVDALAGMAQGFAQAAMPSRMPIPFGAAIGMGMGGALHGAAASQQLQQQAQNIEAAKIGNLQRNLTLDWYRNLPQPGVTSPTPSPAAASSGPTATGNPPIPVNGAPLPPAQGGNVASAAVAGASGAPGAPNYLVDPSSLIQLGDLSMMNGNPRAAAAFYGQAQTMAGGPGYAMTPAGTAAYVPGGKMDPGVQFRTSNMAAAGKVGPALATTAGNINLRNTTQIGTYGPADHQIIGTPAEMVAGAGGTVPGQPPPDPFPGWAQRINVAENSTGNPAATNPNSTAAGNGQFIDQTWLRTVGAARPDIAARYSPQQILAMRNDPQFAQAMTTSYARQNAQVLASSGLPIDGSTLYLAHFFGPQVAASVLRAAPNTPIGMIAPAADVQANPFLKGKTAGDVVAWAHQKMFVAPAAQSANSTTSTPTANAPAGSLIQPAPGGAVSIRDTTGPQDALMETDQKALTDHLAPNLESTNTNIAQIIHERQLADNLNTTLGAGGNVRADISNYLKTYFPKIADNWIQKNTDLPDPVFAQQFQKLMLQSSGQETRQDLGARGGYSAVNLFLKANPSLNMQYGAVTQVLNAKLIAATIDKEYIQGKMAWIQAHSQGWVTGGKNYTPSSAYDAQWAKLPIGQIGAAAMAAINRAPYAEWTKGLSPQEVTQAAKLVARADTTASLFGPDGQLHTYQPPQQTTQPPTSGGGG